MTMMKKILLIEDDELDVMSVQRALKKIDVSHELLTAYNGVEALELLVGKSGNRIMNPLPDIILLDINMPVMNGWEFLDEYNHRNIDPQGKSAIYILSSSVFSEDINRARTYSQVKDFIRKPLDVTRIREILNTKEAV